MLFGAWFWWLLLALVVGLCAKNLYEYTVTGSGSDLAWAMWNAGWAGFDAWMIQRSRSGA